MRCFPANIGKKDGPVGTAFKINGLGWDAVPVRMGHHAKLELEIVLATEGDYYIMYHQRMPTMFKPRIEALRARDKFYQSDKPCKRGHNAPRYVSNNGCKECQREDAAIQAMKLRELAGTEEGERLSMRIRRQRVIDDCGPHSREEAESVGLDWYAVRYSPCHGTVSLDGVTCPSCGSINMHEKQRLEMEVQRMLE